MCSQTAALEVIDIDCGVFEIDADGATALPDVGSSCIGVKWPCILSSAVELDVEVASFPGACSVDIEGNCICTSWVASGTGIGVELLPVLDSGGGESR